MEQGPTPDLTSLDDAALLAVISAKQNAVSSSSILSNAIGILYDRYGSLVYTVAVNIVGDEKLAEEIVQDVFVKVWNNAHTYRPELAKVSSWLISISRHRAIDGLRRRGVRPEMNQTVWTEEGGAEGNQLTSSDTPEKTAEENFRQKTILNLIDSLPPDQRQALRLAFYQGLSHSQIADLLHEPLGTVKSRIHLALKKLHEWFIEHEVQNY